MPLSITLASILFITGAMWLLNRWIRFVRICPICAGVCGTWLVTLSGILLGFLSESEWMPLVAMGMGGSVVGITYQLEKFLPSYRSPLIWKTTFIPLGFVIVYAVVNQQWILIPLPLALLCMIAYIRLDFSVDQSKHTANTKVEDLEKKMKSCC